MDEKKRGCLGRTLSTIALVLGCVYLLLRIFGIIDQHFHFKSLTAHAEDVILTPNETLALIGSSFPITYHNATTGIDFELTAYIYDTTENYWPSGSYGWNIPFKNNSSIIAPYNYADALIYQVPFPEGFQFDTQNTSTSYNMRVEFPFTLSGLEHFEMPVFFSASHNASGGPSYPSRSNALLYTSLGLQTYNALSSSGHHAQGYFNPANKYYPNSETYVYFSCFPINFESSPGDSFSVSSLFCGFNGCKLYDWKPDPDDSGSEYWVFDRFFIMIECPVITDYTPSTTTRPVQTTRSPYTGEYQVTTAQYTYDLSPLETNQINQINIANENLNYVAGIFDGVNIIIQQLDDIYNRMVQNGEIPVNLIQADSLHTFDSDFRANIVNNLTSHTTAQIPDAGSGYSLIHTLYYKFTSGDFQIFAVIGGLSLCLLVSEWFLFKGRGG